MSICARGPPRRAQHGKANMQTTKPQQGRRRSSASYDERADDTLLLPAREVWRLLGISDRTLDRWVRDEALGFPRPRVIYNRRYFIASEIEAFARQAAG